jgi:hypothetical protein
VNKDTTSDQEADRREVPNQELEIDVDNPIQAEGYVRVYRAVRRSVGPEAAYLYGVLEDYFQLSRRNRRPCTPSQADLATHMGTSDRQLRRYLTTLEEKGWIETKQITGNRTKYTIKQTGQFCPVPPRENVQSDRTEMSSPNNKNNLANQTKQIKENPKEKNVGTNNLDNKELGLDYWKGPMGKHRLGAFQLVFDLYPRSDQIQSAMAAWRQTFGERLDLPVTPSMDRLYKSICAGANWYAELCKREKRELKFITAFPKWIRDELWNDAPEHVRVEKAA